MMPISLGQSPSLGRRRNMMVEGFYSAGLPKLALRNGALTICTALCLVTSSLPASAGGKITTFDAPESIGTVAYSINAHGTITGYYIGSDQHDHGFVRAPDGTITAFDPSGSISTFARGVNRMGAIAGFYEDSKDAMHGFVHACGGTSTAFDKSGSIGTYAWRINAKGSITGY